MRIAFFGTPAFAVPSLDALLELGETVTVVVTQPDRPKGRLREVAPPPVKLRALEAGIPVLQPERPTGDAFLATLGAAQPDLGVVVAYGHILRPAVLALPPLGMINVHASLLPAWRGAAPIQWSIAQGDRETGVTIMRMEAGLDSGPIILARSTPIEPSDTGGTLTDRLAELGARALRDVILQFRAGPVTEVAQDHTRATHAPKIGRGIARVNWTLPATDVVNQIRAFDPVPGAWSVLGNTEVKLFGPSRVGFGGPPGTVLTVVPDLVVAAGDGGVRVETVQPAGKPRMAAADWVRGRAVRRGDRFE
ncbi:MAG: methionyl-tRNA formyltransferase [Gemmatimonadetes bacterium]|nr:methionyl-tRNA formyltransferase [Gemmatimonadota bacterium]